MDDICYVVVRRHDIEKQREADWQDLTIDGKNIRFLQEPLLGKRFIAQTKQNHDGDTYWYICFFAGTSDQTELFVQLSPKELDTNGVLARAIWQVPENSRPSREGCERASKFIRSSKSLILDNYSENSGRWFATDGAGFSMMSPKIQKSTFLRSVIMLALACAYRLRMESLVNELSDIDQRRLLKGNLARRASEFNARCYFRYPVKLENNALVEIWEAISNKLRINDLNQELIGQARQLHDLISAEESQREQRRWQLISILLSMISALQVLSLLSEETRAHWWSAIIRWLGLE
jgi:hypothetical protein